MILSAAAACSTCHAASGRGQRFAVELANMAIDTHLLAHGSAPAQRARLKAKIFSGLGVIGLLAREYLQERRESSPRLLAQLRRLRYEYVHGEQTAFASDLERLTRDHPVDARGILPLRDTPRQLGAGKRLYHRLCMSCHAYPDAQSPAPAPDLFRMAHSLPPAEFVARLIGGVRGTPETTLVNPLNQLDIAALAAYLTDHAPHKLSEAQSEHGSTVYKLLSASSKVRRRTGIILK